MVHNLFMQVFKEEYKVRSFNVNLRGRVGLYTILNFVEDVGWRHGRKLGIKLGDDLSWIFTRQKLTMTEWPRMDQNVSLLTWLRPPLSETFLLRDYEIYLQDKKIGEATSSFSAFNLKTRKLERQNWQPFSHLWSPEGSVQLQPTKIPPVTSARSLAVFEVRNSDIDLNNHVNNTKYAQWILDALPIALLKQGAELLGYEVNFISEARVGDVIEIQVAEEIKNEGSVTVTQFQGHHKTEGKVMFTALLTTRE